MPPKVQKKEGSTEAAPSGTSTNAQKEHDVVSIDDILFPKATVSRIAKSVLESEENDKSQFILSKDSLTVIQRSSVVFISHLFHHALQQTKLENRKTANAQDVLDALKKTGFNVYLPILEEELAAFNEKAALKRLSKLSTTKTGEEAEEEEADLDDEEEESNKRIKTNDGSVNTVQNGETNGLIVEDENEDDEEPSLNGVKEDEVEEADDDEEEEEEEETQLKPSQIVEQEHKELEGDNEPAEEGEEDDEDDDNE